MTARCRDAEQDAAMKDPNWSFDYLNHIPNKEVLGAHDNPEAFTPRTPKEVIAVVFRDAVDVEIAIPADEFAAGAIQALRRAGYDVIQRVSQGNANWTGL